LVHQNCQCDGPLLCSCPGDGEVLYVLGDLDLLCLEEDCSSEMWDKMVQRDPAGTEGFKPPEVVSCCVFGLKLIVTIELNGTIAYHQAIGACVLCAL